MEIDGPEYPNISVNHFEANKNEKERTKLVKQTLLHSPIFTKIIPRFHICTNKKFRGLSNTSINDEYDQYLFPPENDSQFDVFGDEEDDLFAKIGANAAGGGGKTAAASAAAAAAGAGAGAGGKSGADEQRKEYKLKAISVIVKVTSMLIDKVEFPFNAEIRSSCLLPGVKDNTSQEEDSLLISLKSGFLFLIRIYLVPRSCRDIDFDAVGQTETREPFVFKPFIVQWWDTSSTRPIPEMNSSGYSLVTHSSGLAAVSTSASDIFRIYNAQHTDAGVMFMSHFNVPVNGIILHSCFIKPLSNSVLDSHRMFFTMVFTDARRLELNLYSWVSGEDLNSNLSKTVLPLNNNFTIPIFIVPLKENGGVLLVSPNELTLITVHDIVSANYDFERQQFEGTFPTNFYSPNTKILNSKRIDSEGEEQEDAEEDDEKVLISTENGLIYSISITKDKKITFFPILKILDQISVFSLEKFSDGYLLIYGNEFGHNREIYIHELYSNSDVDITDKKDKLYVNPFLVINDFKNWAPTIDILIIDSYASRNVNNVSDQELWTLSGGRKRTKLNQLREGYVARKRSKIYEQLRKTNRSFFLAVNGRFYLVCSMPFETMMLEYAQNNQFEFVEIEGPAMDLNSSSIFATTFTFQNELILQVTIDSMILTDLVDVKSKKQFEDRTLMFCDRYKDHVLLLSQAKSSKVSILELYKLNEEVEENFGKSSQFTFMLIDSIEVENQPCMMKIVELQGESYIAMGDYDNILFFYKLNAGLTIEYLDSFNLHEMKGFNENTQGSIFCVINDICIGKELKIYVGLKNGSYLTLKKDVNSLEIMDQIRVGDTPVLFLPSSYSNMTYVLSRGLWLLNLYDSAFPTRVYFEERHDRAIYNINQIPNALKESLDSSNSDTLSIIREDGLLIASVSTHKGPITRSISIPESAKKLLYLPYLSCFMVLCHSADPSNRLKFVDRKYLRSTLYEEVDSKRRSIEVAQPIFKENEHPTSACVWSVKRTTKVSKKVLVGCSINGVRGSLKVLDILKVKQSDTFDTIKLCELISFEHNEVVTNLEQIGSLILFTSGKSIHATIYDSDERKLRATTNLATFTSEIISLSVENDDKILVGTKLDSVYEFTCSKNESFDDYVLVLSSKDPSPKSVLNLVSLDTKVAVVDKLHSSIVFLEKTENVLDKAFSYKLPCIPRVYKSKFHSYWLDREELQDPNILCVGVNGEIISLRLVHESGPELTALRKHIIKLLNDADPIESLIEILNRPFIDKITGKGLLSINKPYFTYKSNKGSAIDYDLEEFLKVSSRNISI